MLVLTYGVIILYYYYILYIILYYYYILLCLILYSSFYSSFLSSSLPFLFPILPYLSSVLLSSSFPLFSSSPLIYSSSSSPSLPSPPFHPTHPLPNPDLSVNSKYTCRCLDILIYIPIPILTSDPACFIGWECRVVQFVFVSGCVSCWCYIILLYIYSSFPLSSSFPFLSLPLLIPPILLNHSSPIFSSFISSSPPSPIFILYVSGLPSPYLYSVGFNLSSNLFFSSFHSRNTCRE